MWPPLLQRIFFPSYFGTSLFSVLTILLSALVSPPPLSPQAALVTQISVTFWSLILESFVYMVLRGFQNRHITAPGSLFQVRLLRTWTEQPSQTLQWALLGTLVSFLWGSDSYYHLITSALWLCATWIGSESTLWLIGKDEFAASQTVLRWPGSSINTRPSRWQLTTKARGFSSTQTLQSWFPQKQKGAQGIPRSPPGSMALLWGWWSLIVRSGWTLCKKCALISMYLSDPCLCLVT